MMKRFFFFLLCVFFAAALFALDMRESDAGLAEEYIDWAQKTIDAGRWIDARAGLERALDFADVSSDISYLLALARLRTGQSRPMALEAVQIALDTDRWDRYDAEDGRLLKAELLVELRRFSAALQELSRVPASGKRALLILRSFKGMNDRAAFARSAKSALAAYPRDPAFARLVFSYYTDKLPDETESALIYTCLRRLSILMESDPSLVCAAVPFIVHTDEAKRLVGAYLASSPVPPPAAMSAALSLGLIEEKNAVNALFAEHALTVDKDLLLSVWELCTDAGRAEMNEKLFSWTGALTEDADNDGIVETSVSYKAGRLSAYREDADQDGVGEFVILFDGGVPSIAEDLSGVAPVLVHWERYPAVLSAFRAGGRFTPAPADFFYEPVLFNELTPGGVLYPSRHPDRTVLTERVLFAASILFERPSAEFSGAVERIELQHSVPLRAREYLDGALVSETMYTGGKAVRQKVDLDLDGVLETVRVF